MSYPKAYMAHVDGTGFPATVQVARAGDHACREYVPKLVTRIVRHGGGGWQCLSCGRRLSWEFGDGKRNYSHCPKCGAEIEVGE